MSREIKFKAWTGKKILEDIILVNNNTVITNIQGFPNNMQAVGEIITDVMQYIGKKDKNGKEIYEDDIVYWEHLNAYGIVYYNEDEAHYYVKPIKSDEETEIYLDSTVMKVIGNKHQNPELL